MWARRYQADKSLRTRSAGEAGAASCQEAVDRSQAHHGETPQVRRKRASEGPASLDRVSQGAGPPPGARMPPPTLKPARGAGERVCDVMCSGDLLCREPCAREGGRGIALAACCVQVTNPANAEGAAPAFCQHFINGPLASASRGCSYIQGAYPITGRPLSPSACATQASRRPALARPRHL